jgi:hypothetical protein
VRLRFSFENIHDSAGVGAIDFSVEEIATLVVVEGVAVGLIVGASVEGSSVVGWTVGLSVRGSLIVGLFVAPLEGFSVGCRVGLSECGLLVVGFVVLVVVLVGSFVGILVRLTTGDVIVAFPAAEVDASRIFKGVGTAVGLVLMLGVSEGALLGVSVGGTLTAVGAGLFDKKLTLLLVPEL